MNEDDICYPLPGISSFAEVLFYDKVDCILTESDWKRVSEHHFFYVHCLLCSYEKLQILLHEYIDQYLDSSTNISHLQNEFDALYPVRDIELDGEFTMNINNKNKNNISIESYV